MIVSSLIKVFLGVQVESIVLSIISMLSSPNDESPANVEAAVSVCLPHTPFSISFYIYAVKVSSLFVSYHSLTSSQIRIFI